MTFACEQNMIEYNGARVCDFLSGYAGTVPQCEKCSKSQKIDLENIKCVDCGVGAIRDSENSCVCDTASHFVEDINSEGCVCDAELNLVFSAAGNTCVCDYENRYAGEPGSCALCPEN